jgi:hypothetical protein
VAGEVTKDAFVIRKIHSAYLVSVVEWVVFVKPLPGTKTIIAFHIITAGTLQMVGNSKLLLYKPENPCTFLMDYFKYLGWTIEIAD